MDNNTFCPTNNFKPIVLNLMKKQTIGDQIYRASSNIKQIASNVWKVIWSQTISNQIYRASSNIIKCLTNKQFQTKCLGSSIFFEKIPKQENVFLMMVCSRISSKGNKRLTSSSPLVIWVFIKLIYLYFGQACQYFTTFQIIFECLTLVWIC